MSITASLPRCGATPSGNVGKDASCPCCRDQDHARLSPHRWTAVVTNGPMQTQPAPMRISPIPQSQVRPDRGDPAFAKPMAYPKAQSTVMYATSGSPPKICIARMRANSTRAACLPSRSQRSADRNPQRTMQHNQEDDVGIVGQDNAAKSITQTGDVRTTALTPKTWPGRYSPRTPVDVYYCVCSHSPCNRENEKTILPGYRAAAIGLPRRGVPPFSPGSQSGRRPLCHCSWTRK